MVVMAILVTLLFILMQQDAPTKLLTCTTRLTKPATDLLGLHYYTMSAPAKKPSAGGLPLRARSSRVAKRKCSVKTEGSENSPMLIVRARLTGTRHGDTQAADGIAADEIGRPDDAEHDEEDDEVPYDLTKHDKAADKRMFPDVGEEELDRKWNSMDLLTQADLKCFPMLPCIEPAAAIRMKTPEQVLQRLMIVGQLSFLQYQSSDRAGFLNTRLKIKRRFHELGWLDSLSCGEERDLLTKPAKTLHAGDMRGTGWLNEDVWMLCYCLNIIDINDAVIIPRGQSSMDNVPVLSTLYIGHAKTTQDFLQQMKEEMNPCGTTMTDATLRRIGTLRDPHHLLDLSDLFYRFHWVVRNKQRVSQLTQDEAKDAHIQELVIMKWRTVVGWILFDHEYDEVPQDT
jgi:hypothetical protein